MSFKRRTACVAALLVLGTLAYAAGRRFSPDLVAHVVEEMLVQKAAPAMDPAQVRRRLRESAGAITDPELRLQKLLALSQRLEKVQTLAPGELERLLPPAAAEGGRKLMEPFLVPLV
jgi:hypothetical protein